VRDTRHADGERCREGQAFGFLVLPGHRRGVTYLGSEGGGREPPGLRDPGCLCPTVTASGSGVYIDFGMPHAVPEYRLVGACFGSAMSPVGGSPITHAHPE
jgi:hypothetical protein